MISHPRNRILLTLLKVERFERWTIKLNKFFEDVMIYTRQDANLDTTDGQSAATLIWTKSATSPNRHQVYDPFFSLASASLWHPPLAQSLFYYSTLLSMLNHPVSILPTPVSLSPLSHLYLYPLLHPPPSQSPCTSLSNGLLEMFLTYWWIDEW